ncbi:MMtag domain-containing protein [Aspergillus clavatus NRRL 1]|uniref:Multiple myeloma tumor-associated protein 2-like N-terminal domain-containing protein n=1 Tax=Aspergillus clavatus (strain ATCC 1007 / CBS 513.65 / DSM 816 / NCTC 3887 / NRRL 1 / QM 1276 / 107) TaxID=344612 RepID=A1CMD3_ASPCL|nr:uncharacterized protein ACLA_096530 [Aspergillus clavatus NRRL 1]EAW08720.1 conserved hypothetical protein [Aspergillus clavatus NRRL 1]
MDLVAGVRKEGSRGGRSEFKWSDVKDSSHRENYLGHSLMAPVGRWQQGRDLQWYAKGDQDDDEQARRDREELQRVKQVEQEAMARALGLPPPPSSADGNANLTPLGGLNEQKALHDSVDEDIAGNKVPDMNRSEADVAATLTDIKLLDQTRVRGIAEDEGANGVGVREGTVYEIVQVTETETESAGIVGTAMGANIAIGVTVTAGPAPVIENSREGDPAHG